MAEKMGLSNEVKEMKLGKSFCKGGDSSFHTFRYDFMPASVDATKRATVDIGDRNQVTVTVPHIEGSGTANTIFKGSRKPYQKECVLIIDHQTGEITLEKLSYNVQLKKTRAEGSSKIRSNTPVDNNFTTKKSPIPQKHSPQPKQQQQQQHAMFSQLSPVQKCSPLPKSPLNGQPSPNNSTNSSMPSLTLPPSSVNNSRPCGSNSQDSSMPTVFSEEMHEQPEIGVLSSSSSSDSSSEESSESASSDNEEMPEAPAQSQPTAVTNGTSSSPLKDMSSSQTSNSLPSMPKFSQLSEDLKLSESDSDSDD